MKYKFISEPADIAAAFERFAHALGVRDHKTWKDHEVFRAYHHPRHKRECVELRSVWAPESSVLITVCRDDPLTTAALIVVDEQERKYIARSGQFAANARDPDLFRQNTMDDVEWINAAGDNTERYLITPLDRVSDADIVENIACFLTKRFVPKSSEEE